MGISQSLYSGKRTIVIATSVALISDLKFHVKAAVEKIAEISGEEKLEILRVPYGHFDELFNINTNNHIIAITNNRIIFIKESKCESYNLTDISKVEHNRNDGFHWFTHYSLILYLKNGNLVRTIIQYEDAAIFLSNYITNKISK